MRIKSLMIEIEESKKKVMIKNNGEDDLSIIDDGIHDMLTEQISYMNIKREII